MQSRFIYAGPPCTYVISIHWTHTWEHLIAPPGINHPLLGAHRTDIPIGYVRRGPCRANMGARLCKAPWKFRKGTYLLERLANIRPLGYDVS